MMCTRFGEEIIIICKSKNDIAHVVFVRTSKLARATHVSTNIIILWQGSIQVCSHKVVIHILMRENIKQKHYA